MKMGGGMEDAGGRSRDIQPPFELRLSLHLFS